VVKKLQKRGNSHALVLDKSMIRSRPGYNEMLQHLAE